MWQVSYYIVDTGVAFAPSQQWQTYSRVDPIPYGNLVCINEDSMLQLFHLEQLLVVWKEICLSRLMRLNFNASIKAAS